MRVQFEDGGLQPFERDRLFMSIVTALGHRRDAVSASTSLTVTIIAKLLETAQGALVTRGAICATAAETLQAFDKAAAVHYRAYHAL
jgi:transcriptional regulator NrdR family protein